VVAVNCVQSVVSVKILASESERLINESEEGPNTTDF
jgi:hypothetical protein